MGQLFKGNIKDTTFHDTSNSFGADGTHSWIWFNIMHIPMVEIKTWLEWGGARLCIEGILKIHT